MKTKTVVLVLVLFLCSAVTGSATIVSDYPGLEPLVEFVGADEMSVLDLVGFKAADRAMKELSVSKGDTNILVLTDAGYVPEIGAYTTEKALDGLMQTSGASRGKGNLINVHKPYNAPLWFAFFDKVSKDCVYLEANSEVIKTYLDSEKIEREVALTDFMNLEDDFIFIRIAKENIDADKLLSDPEPWQEQMVAKVFGGNEFSIITLCNLWAKGLPNDFLKCAELHDHICPGLTSGYLIAEYLKEELPSSDPRREYTIIAIPPWCKEDALITIFETNVGHKRMFVKWLTREQMQMLPEEAKNVADIVIKEDQKTGKREGIVLAFDWDKLFEVSGTNATDFRDFGTYKWWWVRLKQDMWMMDYLDSPETFVSTLKRFTVDSPAEIEKLKSAGVNPLVELGIMPGKAEVEKTSAIPGLGVIAAIVIVGALIYVARRRKAR
ncbi:Protein containing a metal-binding domain shared with formylmethanofuran dehydrogenase subunit E [Methanophagales archaeon]|nr:Protein containing a metal-binding domain shared with formylmethanofuran dehydrogenase subunit E [Methanophagales archaeon]